MPAVSPPPDLRSASVTNLNGVPEQAISKKVVEALSILRVIEKGLNVHLARRRRPLLLAADVEGLFDV